MELIHKEATANNYITLMKFYRTITSNDLFFVKKTIEEKCLIPVSNKALPRKVDVPKTIAFFSQFFTPESINFFETAKPPKPPKPSYFTIQKEKENLLQEVKIAAEKNHLITLIKYLRTITHIGLYEAKITIENECCHKNEPGVSKVASIPKSLAFFTALLNNLQSLNITFDPDTKLPNYSSLSITSITSSHTPKPFPPKPEFPQATPQELIEAFGSLW